MKAVTFDLWNTLISEKDYTEIRINCLAEALKEQGIALDPARIREAYASAINLARVVWERENRRYVSVNETLDHLLERIQIGLPAEAKAAIIRGFREAALKDPPSLREGVVETLEALKPRYRMGIISDTGITPGSIIRTVLERNHVLEHFAATIFSDEVGTCKPHEIMFKTALKGLRAEPQEAAHVGDLLETDVAGAKAVGMRAIWLDNGRSVRPGNHAPDYIITALPQMIAVLDNM